MDNSDTMTNYNDTMTSYNDPWANGNDTKKFNCDDIVTSGSDTVAANDKYPGLVFSASMVLILNS